ncbi:MAG: serine/threonine protein kinase [Polyangiaceae bacterium]|nr:serine/threonine protein kinase [Polyangiaceae bacterium]
MAPRSLVMDLLEGASLGDIDDTLPPHVAIRYLDYCLDALGAAHDAGIVHRDIKPDNILLTLQGNIKLLDVGIATLREHIAGITVVTKEGYVMGTPGYMAPEQARGHWDQVDRQSDIWALGATFSSCCRERQFTPPRPPTRPSGSPWWWRPDR